MKFWSIGFTLVECLVCLIVVGVLLLIAMPTYEFQIIKSTRYSATSSLLILATKLEEYYFNHASYAGATWGELGFSNTDSLPFYRFEMVLNDQTYRICAIPENRQLKDNDCGTLCYTDKGQKSITGYNTIDYCWS